MAKLFCDGEVTASLEVADTFRARLQGLIGRSSIDGAMLITKASSVHTFGVQFPIDVAFVDEDMVVVDTITMKPYGVSLPRRKSRSVVEAAAGSFDQWGLRKGCHLEVRA